MINSEALISSKQNQVMSSSIICCSEIIKKTGIRFLLTNILLYFSVFSIIVKILLMKLKNSRKNFTLKVQQEREDLHPLSCLSALTETFWEGSAEFH